MISIKNKSITGVLIWIVYFSFFIANPKAHISLISILCVIELNRMLKKLNYSLYLPILLAGALYIYSATRCYLRILKVFDISLPILISFIAIGSDSFSYIAGTFFKRQQQKIKDGRLKAIYDFFCFRPFNVSPNKTVIGFIFAGLGGVAAIAGLKLIVALSSFITIINPVTSFLKSLFILDCFTFEIGFCLGLCGQVGDLLESSVKRLCKVKDSGSILADHGGLCDRYDSTYSTIYGVFVVLLLSKWGKLL